MRTQYAAAVVISVLIAGGCATRGTVGEKGAGEAPGTGGAAGEEAKASGGRRGEVLAEGAGVLITEEMLEERIEAMKPLRKKRFETAQGKKKLLDSMVMMAILYAECKREGLDRDKEILTRVESYKKNQAIAKLRRSVLDQVKVDETEMRAEYEKEIDRYRVPKRVRVSQIVLSWDSGTSPEKIAALEKQAEDIQERAIKGEDFAKLARDYSLDQESRARGGDIGFVSRMRVPKQVFEAAMELEKEGDISGVVRGEREFRILKATELVPGRTKTFEEVKPWLERSLLNRKKREAWADYVERLKEKAGVVVHEDRIADAEPRPGVKSEDRK